jgi:molybdopterin-guanine dinucleotide biosynthesis protein A
MTEFTGILLCGGKSLRMGTDKALLELKDMPMALYPLKILKNWCSEILISANDNRLDFLGHSVVHDEILNIGPMGGLFSCLTKSAHDWNIVVACDMPLITGTMLSRMIDAAKDCQAVVPIVNNRPEPLYALYHRTILPEMKLSIGKENYSIQKFLSQLNVCYIEPASDEVEEFFNINTPAERLTYEHLARKTLF